MAFVWLSQGLWFSFFSGRFKLLSKAISASQLGHTAAVEVLMSLGLSKREAEGALCWGMLNVTLESGDNGMPRAFVCYVFSSSTFSY